MKGGPGGGKRGDPGGGGQTCNTCRAYDTRKVERVCDEWQSDEDKLHTLSGRHMKKMLETSGRSFDFNTCRSQSCVSP